MYSKELQELDEGTIQYMMDEMQEQIKEKEEEARLQIGEKEEVRLQMKEKEEKARIQMEEKEEELKKARVQIEEMKHRIQMLENAGK